MSSKLGRAGAIGLRSECPRRWGLARGFVGINSVVAGTSWKFQFDSTSPTASVDSVDRSSTTTIKMEVSPGVAAASLNQASRGNERRALCEGLLFDLHWIKSFRH